MPSALPLSILLTTNSTSQENRPFSVQNIVDALQKEGVKKTAVERALANLVEKELVTKKEYGKAKIFLLSQAQLDLPDPDDAKAIDEDLRKHTDDLSAVNSRVSDLRQRVNALSSQYTLEEAREKLDQGKEQLASKKEKLEKLGDPANLMSKEDKLSAEKTYYENRQLWKKYKKLIKSVVDQVGEATGRKTQDLHDEIGIETDQDVSVDITSFPDIPNPLKAKRPGQSAIAQKRQRLS